MIDGAQTQAKNARIEMIEQGLKRIPPLNESLVEFVSPVAVPGWRGDVFEAWRADSLAGLTHALGQRNSAYRDWISPFVELDGLVGSARWNEFWIYHAGAQTLPRQWIRWAHSFVQRFRKVTPGTPGDTQLSTYFLEADVVITADKILLEILEEMRPHSPCDLPVGRLVPGGADGVSELFDYLSARPQRGIG